MIWSSGRRRLENTDPTSWPADERPPRWTPNALSYWEIKNCAGSWHSTTELLPLKSHLILTKASLVDKAPTIQPENPDSTTDASPNIQQRQIVQPIWSFLKTS